MNNFQIIFVSIFLSVFIFAVLIFSGIIKLGDNTLESKDIIGKVSIWGTLGGAELQRVLQDINGENPDLVISYSRKESSTYQQELIEAFANGTGPDIFLIDPSMIVRNKNFIYKIPFTSYPEKVFRNEFIDGADVYVASDGIVGVPIFVDPIVLYYNKDMFTNAGLASVPSTWDQLYDLAPRLTNKKDDGTILSSMIALGRYDNINNSKAILSTLFMQGGNDLIKRDKDTYYSTLTDNPLGLAIPPVENALKFFVSFSNPLEKVYSWNKSFSSSFDMFTANKLSIYIGYASELFKIQSVNPNLSFDVTDILQTKGAKNKRTYGNIYAFAISKQSPNKALALNVSRLLSSSKNASLLSSAVSLPTASRALLSTVPTDPYLYTFYTSAIISRSWLDPNPVSTNNIFGELLSNILSNKLDISQSVFKASNQLDYLIKQ